jgi:hypothetical protein
MALLLLDNDAGVNFFVKTRLLIGILLAAMGGTAFAGIYQRTRHTHAKVWNDQPTSFQEVTWSGGKDGAGFATGYGTLTWYAPEKPPTTGSNIPNRRRMVVTASYSGTMVRGKFVGPTTSGNAAQTNPPQTAQKKRAPSRTPAEETPPSSVKEKIAPATTSTPTASPATSAASPTPAASATASPDSLNSLTRPPSSLNLNTPAETSPSPHPTPDQSSSPSP